MAGPFLFGDSAYSSSNPSGRIDAELAHRLVAFLARHGSETSGFIGTAFPSETAKLQLVALLLSHLEVVLQMLNRRDTSTSDDEIDKETIALVIHTLRVLIREDGGCDAVFEEKGIVLLMKYANIIHTEDTEGSYKGFSETNVSLEALKCLVNCLWKSSLSRDIFCKQGGVGVIVKHLQNNSGIMSLDIKFLILRLLFILTSYSPKLIKDLGEPIVSEFGSVLTSILLPVATHLSTQCPQSSGFANETMVATDLLKLLFNLTMDQSNASSTVFGIPNASSSSSKNTLKDEHIASIDRKKNHVKGYESLLDPITKLILTHPLNPNDPLNEPLNHAINALINYPMDTSFLATVIPFQVAANVPIKLVEVLSAALNCIMPYPNFCDASRQDGEVECVEVMLPSGKADDVILPLVVVLRDLALGIDRCRDYLKLVLIPDDIDRTHKLTDSDTITSRLIRLMTSIRMENLKNAVSELLYALCDCDASKLVAYVGYGNAAGFLFSRGIFTPPETSNTTKTSTTSASASSSSSNANISTTIDPITGEFVDVSKVAKGREEWDALTEEEKEAEAEKLSDLLQKLEKNGIIKMEMNKK